MAHSSEKLYPPKLDDSKKSEVPCLRSRTYEYVTYEEALKNLELSSENHLNEKKFLDFNDYRTIDFDGEFTDALQPFIPRESIKYKRYRGRKDQSFTAWLIMKDDVDEPFKIDSSFLEKAFEPKVTAVTLLNSDEVRLMRISLKENGSRLYEIINGSCKICFDLMDKVFGKCSVNAVLRSDSRVDMVNGPCLNSEDLSENRDVFVKFGKGSNPEFSLREIFSKCHE